MKTEKGLCKNEFCSSPFFFEYGECVTSWEKTLPERGENEDQRKRRKHIDDRVLTDFGHAHTCRNAQYTAAGDEICQHGVAHHGNQNLCQKEKAGENGKLGNRDQTDGDSHAAPVYQGDEEIQNCFGFWKHTAT